MEKRKRIISLVVFVVLVCIYFISKSYKNDKKNSNDSYEVLINNEYKPVTEYEILAYNAFLERFGDIQNIKVSNISTSETNYDRIRNNLYDEYCEIEESAYTQFLEAEVQFFLDKDSGNLTAGYNTHRYYLGLSKDGNYIVLGETVLG